MMQTPYVGLLPLYLALYEETLPSLRESLEPFRRGVAAMFTGAGVRVCELPICCVKSEFQEAVARARERTWTSWSPCTWPTRHRSNPQMRSRPARRRC